MSGFGRQYPDVVRFDLDTRCESRMLFGSLHRLTLEDTNGITPRLKKFTKNLCFLHASVMFISQHCLCAEELFAAYVYCHEKEALWTKHYAGVCSGWLLP